MTRARKPVSQISKAWSEQLSETSAPKPDCFEPADEAELKATLQELNERAEAAAEETFPDTLVIEACRDDMRDIERVLRLLEAGKRVYTANDEDGLWWLVTP